jgi:hypothetical protein
MNAATLIIVIVIVIRGTMRNMDMVRIRRRIINEILHSI